LLRKRFSFVSRRRTKNKFLQMKMTELFFERLSFSMSLHVEVARRRPPFFRHSGQAARKVRGVSRNPVSRSTRKTVF
jgi:hypothetical protein